MNVCVIGDCRETLARWVAEGVRVQTVVTSPPYWGLRDYQLPPLEWGGTAGCAHDWSQNVIRSMSGGVGNGTIEGSQQGVLKGGDVRFRSVSSSCLRCSAWRGSLGLESTPELYVQHLVEVFRWVRDVLCEDGTLWLNLGDSYANDGKWGGSTGGKHVEALHGATGIGRRRVSTGLKPKDLVGIPWRVAFALQADDWYLRSDIVWSKPNPMPESVTDRPTKAHEYLFLLAKSERYYYDAAAIREPATNGERFHGARDDSSIVTTRTAARNGRVDSDNVTTFRNRRSVWTIATQPYAAAHFATFPEDLVKPCILAGSRPGDVVLDPFLGSGTVAKVAQDLGRQWLGCELSECYGTLIAQRVPQLGLLLR